MFLKRLGLVVGSVAVLVLNLGSVVQGAEQFVQVGFDSDGDPFELDVLSMGKPDTTNKKEVSFGAEVIKMYQLKGDLMVEYVLDASCGDESLWLVGIRAYNRSNVKVREQKQNEKLPAHGDSPSGKAMKFYCQAIHARGW